MNAAKVAAICRETEMEPEEIVERITRRSFLAGIGSVAAASSSRGLHLTPVLRSSPRIAVVGAGISGLAAAYYLRRAGLGAEVFEASQRLGGRVKTSTEFFPGSVCEVGGEFIDSNHKDIRRLAADLGLELTDIKGGRESRYERTFLVEGRRISEIELARAMSQMLQELERLDSVALPFRGIRSPSAARRDHVSLSEFIERQHCDKWLKSLLQTVYTAEFGLDTGAQSSLNALGIIQVSRNGKASYYGDSDERFKIRGGNQQLAVELAKRLSGQVKFGWKLDRLTEGTHGYELELQSEGKAARKKFDYVIVAAPFSVLRKIELRVALNPRQREAIDELGYGENTKMMLGVSQRVWRDQGFSGEAATDLGIQTTWDGSRGTDGSSGFVTCYLGGSGARAYARTEPVRTAVGELTSLFHGFGSTFSGSCHIADWGSNPLSHGSYSCYKVGQYTRFRGFESLSSKGLFFAGEHCSLEFKGFMNGAAESGRIAAEALIRLIRR